MSEPTHPHQSTAADRRSRRRELLNWIAAAVVLAVLFAGVAVCLVLDHRVVLRIGALLLSAAAGGMVVGPIAYLRGVYDEGHTDRKTVDGAALLEAVRRISADHGDDSRP